MNGKLSHSANWREGQDLLSSWALLFIFSAVAAVAAVAAAEPKNELKPKRHTFEATGTEWRRPSSQVGLAPKHFLGATRPQERRTLESRDDE